MRWFISCQFLVGVVIAVTGDMFGPLNFAHYAHLFRYQGDLQNNYGLNEVEDSTATACLSPFMEIEGRCLYLSSDPNDWQDWNSAQKACEVINGNLVEIAPEEQVPLAEYLFNNTGDSYIYGAFWTGGNDEKNEDDWLWLNGNPVDGDFGEDESNNITGPAENCLLLAAKQAVYMNQKCEMRWRYLCEPGPCYNTTCGNNAHCNAFDYVTSDCICNEGYEGDADTECTAINPCDAVTCGSHAVCIRESWNKYHCECEEGYAGEPPNTACVFNPCSNITCGAHAACSKFNNTAAECHCNNGYTGNPIHGCTLIDPCEGVVCGEHASCHVTGPTGECRCDEGYPNGDPLVKCSAGGQNYASMILLALCMTILFGQQTRS